MMQYGSIDKRILKLVCCLRCKYLQQWKKNNVFDETDTYRDQEHCWQIAIWSSKLNNTCSQTVTEDTLWLNTMKVKLSCMDSLSSKKKKTHGWCCGGGDELRFFHSRCHQLKLIHQMTAEGDTNITGPRAGYPSLDRAAVFSIHFNQSVHHTYVRPTRGYKQWTAGAKQRRSSCSALPSDQSLLQQ